MFLQQSKEYGNQTEEMWYPNTGGEGFDARGITIIQWDMTGT